VGRPVAESGKIKLLKESLNVIAAAQTSNARGVAELPLPEAEIFSAKTWLGQLGFENPADARKTHDVAGEVGKP
jgi:hypothetical protein